MNDPSECDRRLLEAFLRNDFLTFFEMVFRELHPGKSFVPNWHHEALAYWVEASAINAEIHELIFNLPPRSLKSEMISIALPAFLLGRDPTKRIIVVSHDKTLAEAFSRQTRQVMRSDWYRRLFPSTAIVGQGALGQFFTTAGGYRVALSIGTNFTGRGGDLIIIDDPMNADDAYSLVARASLTAWATQVLFSRLDDKQEGVILLVAQRLHEDDLCGVLERSGWPAIKVPAIAEQDETMTIGRNPLRRHFRREGEPMDAQREPLPTLAKLRRQMGESVFLAQYQQRPVPPEGDVIKLAWFERYCEPRDGGQLFLSIDTASKAGERNDYSVAQLWRVIDNQYYLELSWRRKVEFPELLLMVKTIAQDLRPDTILIEDKGHGTGLIQMLRHEGGFPVVAYDPGQLDKESRMKIQSAKVEGRLVYLPEDAPWLNDFLDEVRRFPTGAHDDQIDAMSQLLDHASRRSNALIIGTYGRGRGRL